MGGWEVLLTATAGDAVYAYSDGKESKQYSMAYCMHVSRLFKGRLALWCSLKPTCSHCGILQSCKFNADTVHLMRMKERRADMRLSAEHKKSRR